MLLSLFFLFIFITSNLGYILWLVDRLDVQAEAAPVFVIFAQMVTLYFCSLAGLLQPAMVILYAMGWLLLGVVLVKHRRDLRSFLRKQATPGFVFFLLIVPLLWFQTRTSKFANWDEFSHWGLIFKEISQTNLLPGLNTTLIFPDYPPGTALYQVFINYLMRYEEGSAYFAQGLMMLSPLVSLTHHFKWKKWYAVLGVYTAGFLLVNQMNYTLNSIYVDGLIGILFGTSAAFFLTHKEPNKKTFLYLLPMLLALPLIKKSGIFFSLSVTLLALGSYLFLQKGQFEEIKNWLHRTDRHKWGNALAVAVLLLAVTAGPLLVADSWSRHVTDFEKETGIQITAPVSISLEKLNHSFFGETTPRDDATITAFVKGLQEKPFGKTATI
ncbi:MAG: hypothetical protein Q7U74_12870 [Saprospiraceae bacterium]|nr:hypothetical protein [Saprospiraceae bacterium]